MALALAQRKEAAFPSIPFHERGGPARHPLEREPAQ